VSGFISKYSSSYLNFEKYYFMKPLRNILFLDIETTSGKAHFEQLSSKEQLLFAEKTLYQRQKEDLTPEQFYHKAGIWAEFGKVICVSVGYFSSDFPLQRAFRITSFYGEEKDVLLKVKDLIENYFSSPQHYLCAHNGKEFDFPFLARRMLIQGIILPEALNTMGKKPWEVPFLDTMELWKFGDFKHYTSLKLLTHIFGIPSPKDDIDGSEVHGVYYEQNDIKRIVTYCEKDVLALTQVYLKLCNQKLLTEDEVQVL